MAHTIDQPLAVKYLLVQHPLKVLLHLCVIADIFHILPDICHHFHNLQIGASVLWSFQR